MSLCDYMRRIWIHISHTSPCWFYRHALCARFAGYFDKEIAMLNDKNYRLAQKYLSLAILVSKLAKLVLELLSMAFNYHSYSPRHAST